MATTRTKAATQTDRLRAAGFVAFKAIWLALLVLAVVAPIAGAWQRTNHVERNIRPFERAGLAVDRSSGRLRLATPYSEEARRSGIADGDRIIAINGQVVSDSLESRPILAALLRGPEGSKVAIRTRSAEGGERDHVLTRSQANIDRDFAASGISLATHQAAMLTLGSLPALGLIVAAVMLFRRRAGDLVPALFSLSFLLRSATLRDTSFFYTELGLSRAVELLGVVWLDLFILALLLFPNGRFAQRWAPWVALLLIPDALASYFHLLPSQYPISYPLLVAALASLLLRYWRLPVGSERQQVRWALLGFAAGIVATGIANSISFLNFYYEFDRARIWTPLFSLGFFTLADICFAAGLLVSLLKYRLYDADVVIRRSAGYAVLTVMLAPAVAACAKGVEVLFETGFGRQSAAWSGVIGAGLAVALITPLHGRVHAWAERRFQKGLLHMRRDLPLCVGDLRETASMDELLAETVDRIARGVRANRVAVLLDGKVAAGRGLDGATAVPDLPGDASEMTVDREDRVFPLRIPLRNGHRADDAPVGWLLLGPRPDGSLYGRDELDALHEIVDPVARAVRIVQLREARERESRASATRHGRRIKALEKAVAALTARPTPAPA